MAKIIMYTTNTCPYCKNAKQLLKEKGVPDSQIEEIRVDLDPDQRVVMINKTGRRTVPQIYIDDTHIGGFDDLQQWDRQGKLMPLLVQ